MKKLRRKLCWVGLLFWLGIFFIGCSNHLIYVQETSVGVNLGLGTEGTEKLTVGYDRDVYSIVPENEDTGDAMSLLSLNKAEITGLNTIKVSEFVAGGIPAKNLAASPEAVANLREKIYGGGK